MNNTENNNYQDDFQTPVGVPVAPSTEGASGYNDTYYDQSYSDTKYNEYEEPKKTFPWKVVIIIVLAILFIFLFWYFLFGGGGSNGNVQYETLTTKLCEKALEYERKHEGTVDRNTPGATAYIRIQYLIDDYLIDSKPIKDPRYKSSIFSKSQYKEYISPDSYLRLSVASNGEPYCEGFVDTSDDHNKPIISLKGTSPITLAKGTNFEDPGAIATDDVDGDVTDKIQRSGSVDISKVGEYTITYTVTDTSGNVATTKRVIIIEEYTDIEITLGSHFDSITPQIELKGSNPYCMELNTTYKEPGAIATDNVDGNITNKIIVDSSNVTGIRTGNFRVTYTVSDTFGHKAIAYRSVMVMTKCKNDVTIVDPINTRPVISVIGESAITINLYEDYRDRGATAWDKEDGKLEVKVFSNVNTQIAGIYDVTYIATDSGGLKATAKRKVTVFDPNAINNVAQFIDIPQNLRIPLGSEQVIPVPQAKDSRGNALTVRTVIKDSTGAIVTSIDFYRVGVYTTYYYAKPANGVEQSLSRTVTIYDSVAPTLELPNQVFIIVRTTNCNISTQDLLSSGMIVSDAPNLVAPIVVISGGENKVCALNNNGIDIQVFARDESGNVSPTKTTKVFIVETAEGGDPTNVAIGNCGTNGELEMFIGDTATLVAQVFPVNANNRNVSWVSLLPAYVTVDQGGNLTAIAAGSSDVKVTTAVGGKTAICKVVVRQRVIEVPVTGVSISDCESGTMTMTLGAHKVLSAIVNPTNASNKSVSWVSSNLDVVGMLYPKCADPKIKCIGANDGNANLFANKIGESVIKVTTEDGAKTKECKITVTESTVVDTTAPSQVIITAHNGNPSDPYNKSGETIGNNKELRITLKTTEPESKITKFEMFNGQNKLLLTILPEVSDSNVGIAVIKKDIDEGVYFTATNSAGLVSPKSKYAIASLDNTGPRITFEKWMQDPNEWVSKPNVIIEYSATDLTGVVAFEYTHNDVKAAKSDADIVIHNAPQITEPQCSTVNSPVINNDGVVMMTNCINMVSSQMTFLESNINKYVYVRAVDKLGNKGPWTEKPSYLNMDTVAPMAPGLSIVAGTNNTNNVKIQFTFTDNTSPKISGFGKYEYSLNGGGVQTKTTETDPLSLTTIGNYTISASSYDKAGNKSASPSTLGGIVVKDTTTPPPPPPPPSTNMSVTSVGCPISIEVGKTAVIKYTTAGFSSNATVAIASLNVNIVNIDNQGTKTIKGIAAGSTTIEIIAMEKLQGDTDFTVKKATCTVTVVAPPPPAAKTCVAYTNSYASGICQPSGQVGDATYKRCKYAYRQKLISGSGTNTSNYVYSSSTEAMNACKNNVIAGYACEDTPVRTYTYTCVHYE